MARAMQVFLILFALSLLPTYGFVVFGAAAKAEEPSSAATVAREILDDTKPDEVRQKLAADNPAISARLIREMTKGLESQADLKEEYRRIPWIWRVAVAAGKRNETKEIRRILEASLPGKGDKLEDWQAVVIGGGIINGIGLVGGWPSERIETIVSDNPELADRWKRVQDQAAVMTEDPSVFKGTRYDAIRILGVGTWDHRGAQIFRYLLQGVDDELQMGAISALGDMRSPSIGQALLSGFSHYSETNREMALDALLRENSRILALLEAIKDQRVTAKMLGDKRVQILRANTDPSIRSLVEQNLR